MSSTAEAHGRSTPPAARAARYLALLSIAFLTLYAVTWRVLLNGDSQAHLFEAASLAWSHDFDVTEYTDVLKVRSGGSLPYYVFESNGGLYSIFNPTPGVLLAPLFALAEAITPGFRDDIGRWGQAGRLAAVAFLFGTGLLVWSLLHRRIGVRPAALAVAAIWFGSACWPLSVNYLQHQPASFFRAAALLALLGSSSEFRPSSRRAFVAGLALAMSVLCRYQTAPAMALVAAYCAWRALDTWPRRFAFGGGLAILVPLAMLYHHHIFGGALRIGPTLWLDFDSPFLYTLGALLVNPSKGLLLHMPWVMFGVLAFKRTRGESTRITEPLPVICALSFIATLLLYSRLNGWFAGWAWGPRYMLDAMPELAILFALGVARWRASRLVRGAAVALLGVACTIQSIGALAYDGEWHARHDLGIGPSQAWLWQTRHSQVLYYARRGRIYLGPREIALRDNPFKSRGLFAPEPLGDTTVRWTEPSASFLFIAREPNPRLRVYAPIAQRVKVAVNGETAIIQELNAGEWSELPLPQIAFQHSAVLKVSTKPPYEPGGKQARRLGVAIESSQIVPP